MSQHMKIFTDTDWTVIGFFIFFVLFLLFVGSTFLKSQMRIHAHLEKLPFEKETRAQEHT